MSTISQTESPKTWILIDSLNTTPKESVPINLDYIILNGILIPIDTVPSSEKTEIHNNTSSLGENNGFITGMRDARKGYENDPNIIDVPVADNNEPSSVKTDLHNNPSSLGENNVFTAVTLEGVLDPRHIDFEEILSTNGTEQISKPEQDRATLNIELKKYTTGKGLDLDLDLYSDKIIETLLNVISETNFLEEGKKRNSFEENIRNFVNVLLGYQCFRVESKIFQHSASIGDRIAVMESTILGETDIKVLMQTIQNLKELHTANVTPIEPRELDSMPGQIMRLQTNTEEPISLRDLFFERYNKGEITLPSHHTNKSAAIELETFGRNLNYSCSNSNWQEAIDFLKSQIERDEVSSSTLPKVVQYNSIIDKIKQFNQLQIDLGNLEQNNISDITELNNYRDSLVRAKTSVSLVPALMQKKAISLRESTECKIRNNQNLLDILAFDQKVIKFEKHTFDLSKKIKQAIAVLEASPESINFDLVSFLKILYKDLNNNKPSQEKLNLIEYNFENLISRAYTRKKTDTTFKEELDLCYKNYVNELDNLNYVSILRKERVGVIAEDDNKFLPKKPLLYSINDFFTGTQTKLENTPSWTMNLGISVAKYIYSTAKAFPVTKPVVWAADKTIIPLTSWVGRGLWRGLKSVGSFVKDKVINIG
jgi:hypothetical protein